MEKKAAATKRDFAYECILNKIVTECLAPGTPLREDHLAEEFGISATPIREALRKLELEGWLRSLPNCGCSVRKFSRDEIGEVYYFREALEGMAAALAAKNATGEDLKDMQKILDDDAAYIAAHGDSEEPGALISRPGYDLDFHDLLFRAAHSPMLEERYRVSQGQLKLLVMSGAGRLFPIEHLRAVNEEHQMVYWAILRHWPDVAENLIRHHIDKARRLALHALPVVEKKTRHPKVR